MHVHIVLCCGVKTVLFTNKLSEYWCRIINPYLFTKFHTSKHLGKRVTQTCMFTLFFVVVRKGYCLPTSYQNVGVISVIPICLQRFMHPSILVRELHKDACSHCSTTVLGDRDGGGGLALSVYIRKLSFSPSISSQMDSYLYHCDYTIKATIG